MEDSIENQVNAIKCKAVTVMNVLEPPTFISDDKPFEVYKMDLERWSRLTSLDKKLQAEMVVYKLGNHPSRIQEKITTQLGDKLVNNEKGIEELLKFLKSIYEKDSMADAWDKYVKFEKSKHDGKVPLKEYIAEWENKYHQLKNVGCEYADMILAFKLLDASNLTEVDQKFVLTGVDYSTGLKAKTLFDQMKESLKKFKGQNVIGKEEEKGSGVQETYAAMEEVFLSKGWVPPKKRKLNEKEDAISGGYKGKKNKLDENGFPMKCFKCKCDCTTNCNHPCRYHFSDKCSDNKIKSGKEKKDLTHFVKTNLPHVTTPMTLFTTTEDSQSLSPNGNNVCQNEELVMLMNHSCAGDNNDDEVCLATSTKKETNLLIDCACPTTVAGEKWIMGFNEQFFKEDKQRVQVKSSKKIFKFGGGETRKSKCIFEFPCSLGGLDMKINAEIIDADLPLLLGNNSLEKAKAILDVGNKKIKLFQKEIDVSKTASGHFSLDIEPQRKKTLDTQLDIKCLVSDTKEELTEKELKKIHNTLGHVSVDKLE